MPAQVSPASAVILAGGRSLRMGRDKASSRIGGRSLLRWTTDVVRVLDGVEEVMVVLAGAQAPPPDLTDDVHLVRDALDFEGPLAALITGAERTPHEVILILGCDTPLVRPALLALLLERARDHAIVVPLHEGRPQPLCSAIRREVIPDLRAALGSGSRAASILADHPQALRLTEEEWRAVDPDGISFVGANTPEEFAHLEALCRASEASDRA